MKLLRVWQTKIKTTYLGFLGLTLSTNLIIAILSIIGGILAARLLGPGGRGELAAIQTFPTVLAWIAMLGIPDALVYYSARKPKKSGSMLTTAIIMDLVFCIPFMIIGFFLLPIILRAQSYDVIKASQEYLWLLPILATTGMFVNPLRGVSDIAAWNLVRILPTIVWFLLLLIYFILRIENVFILTNSYLLGLAFLIIPSSLIFNKRIGGSYVPSKEFIKPLLSYGLPASMSMIPFLINSRLDQIVLSAFLDPYTIGLYAIGFTYSNALKPFTNVLPAVMLPHIAKKNQFNEQVEIMAQNFRVGFFISLLLGIVVSILAPLFIPLFFGQEFSPAIPIAIILSVAAGFLGCNQILKAGALGMGKPNVVLIAEIVGLIVLVVMLAVSINKYKLIGAAISSLVSYITVTILLIISLKNLTSLNLSTLLIPQKDEFVTILLKIKELFSGES